MRENSLGWNDGMDSVEALQELEAVFEIEISDYEAEAMETVGDLFAGIQGKLAAGESGKCATAMAFYRLRRGLDANLMPSSDISHLDVRGAKEVLQMLRQTTGLNVPAARYATLGKIGCGVACISGLAFSVALIVFLCEQGMAGLAFVGGSALGLAAGILAALMDKGLLPRDCKTLGGLARATASASYGKLVKLGARPREYEIWDILADVLAARANVLAGNINRETTYYEGQKRRTA